MISKGVGLFLPHSVLENLKAILSSLFCLCSEQTAPIGTSMCATPVSFTFQRGDFMCLLLTLELSAFGTLPSVTCLCGPPMTLPLFIALHPMASQVIFVVSRANTAWVPPSRKGMGGSPSVYNHWVAAHGGDHQELWDKYR